MPANEFFKNYTFGSRKSRDDGIQNLKISDSTSPCLVSYPRPSEWRAMKRSQELILPILPGHFRFQGLPGEIKNQIYRELLLTNIPLQLIQSHPVWPDLHDPGYKLHPTILRANRQIHQEAASVLYGENTFYVHVGTSATLARDQMSWSSFGSEKALAPSIKSYMPLLRRITVYSWVSGTVRTRLEICNLFQIIGVNLRYLTLFALKFPDVETMELNARAGGRWLVKREGKELATKFVWFPPQEIPHLSLGTWLVKEDERVTGVGLLPGLGAI
ncbi:uncharacterized protein BDR25DRAFT_340666 [Lindgomyces ingoldianus]|uniref:Uncharacterized protein n=1 Tax=Lindgomyces ingoldianus TaxID=673940 RepID=A0ACB6R453_9PLEO|nr:uncharacterized protein BDR25DRAFT_340666 [Lindgomyces ingoldianus]KAF2474039.1 hypothetical protein BDR25DRAFT_340666 [Lindgomyces ingoldianus]